MVQDKYSGEAMPRSHGATKFAWWGHKNLMVRVANGKSSRQWLAHQWNDYHYLTTTPSTLLTPTAPNNRAISSAEVRLAYADHTYASPTSAELIAPRTSPRA